MKLKVIAQGNEPFSTTVVDAETGEELEGVAAVTFRHKAGEFPRLTVELEEFSIEAECVAEPE